jgi:PHP family Zn ribbon phosphoesterase
MQDLAKVYAEVARACDRGMQELPTHYTLPRKSALQKYQDFVDIFDSVSNDMQELRSMCDTVAAYVHCVMMEKLA